MGQIINIFIIFSYSMLSLVISSVKKILIYLQTTFIPLIDMVQLAIYFVKTRPLTEIIAKIRNRKLIYLIIKLS